MIQLDGFRRTFAIDDSWHFTGTTQAAARTRALQCALSGANFNWHLLSPKCGSPADQMTRLIKPCKSLRNLRWHRPCSYYLSHGLFNTIIMNNDSLNLVAYLSIVSASRLATLSC